MDAKTITSVKQFLLTDAESNSVTVSNSHGFIHGARVELGSTAVPSFNALVKKVEKNIIELITDVDLSILKESDNSFIKQPTQPRVLIGKEDAGRYSYQESPANAVRTVLIDPIGDFIDIENPLPVTFSETGMKTSIVGYDLTHSRINELIVNDDGTLNVTAYIQEGTPVPEKLVNIFNEKTLLELSEDFIGTYRTPVGKISLLLEITCYGGNIADFIVEYDSQIISKANTYYTNFNTTFNFRGEGSKNSRGLVLESNKWLKIKANNWKSQGANFYCKMLILEIG